MITNIVTAVFNNFATLFIIRINNSLFIITKVNQLYNNYLAIFTKIICMITHDDNCSSPLTPT